MLKVQNLKSSLTLRLQNVRQVLFFYIDRPCPDLVKSLLTYTM